jgi:predicted transcriptional regulator
MEGTISTGTYLATKERFKLFSMQEQKILMMLIDNQPSTNSEIARKCWSSHQSISSILHRLKKKKVITDATEGRNTNWSILDTEIYEYLRGLNLRFSIKFLEEN